MASLEVDGARIEYRTSGTGPPLLAPECNYTWTPAVEAELARHFTLIVASPRDFGASTRTGGPEYDADRWATDLAAVLRHVGHPRVLFFGYSFTGAFGPWLARRLRSTGAIAAVASGGFPLLGDYRITFDDVQQQCTELQRDPALWEQLQQRFDLLAGSAFYRDLATEETDALVDDLPCPLYCFWGDQDTDAVELVLSHEAYRAGLSRRGIPFQILPGYDHEGLNGALEVALPPVVDWLLGQADQRGLAGGAADR